MSTTTESSTVSGLRPPARDELDPEERMSRDELEALQLERLQQTVRHAYEHVPLYTTKFDEAGVHPDDIRSLDDVAKLPFTTKEDLRQTYPFGMFAVPMDRVARIHASSGTTGRPTVVGYTKGDLDNWATLIARSLRGSGIRPGMKVHNAYGYGLFTGGLGAHGGIEKLGATVIPMSGGQTARQVQLIRDFEPDAILCTPSYLLTIADAMADAGIDPHSTSLKVGVLGAEPWTNELRRELQQRLGIDALDIYGLSEVMGPGVGNECLETKDGPHIWEDHFLPEIVDGDSLDRAARRHDGRARVHVAHERGVPGHPVPHARPHAPAARYRATRHAPHREDHRPQRRHDHPARRQPLPDADRGDRARHRAAHAALHPRAHEEGHDGRHDRAHRTPPRPVGRGLPGRDGRARRAHQAVRRVIRRRAASRSRARCPAARASTSASTTCARSERTAAGAGWKTEGDV